LIDRDELRLEPGMSRMFKVLSGGTSPRAIAEAAVPAADDVPFVEVGDPGGPVFSSGLSLLEVEAPAAVAAPVPEPIPAAEPAPVPLAERTFPRLASPKYLSVTFHDLTGRPRVFAEREGPDSGLVALHLPDHPISGEYRTLKDEIRAQLPEPIPRVIWFSAAAGESGTTSVLLNLAVTLARESAPRVLVVDANLEHPSVAQKFAIGKSVPGLSEVLAQQIPLAWAVQASTIPNLQILPAGTVTAATASSLPQDLPRFIDQLRQWYDWVLVDSGIWGAAPERDGLSSAADAIYLVTREADAESIEFAGLRNRIRETGGLLRGYIATKV
jgi:Mrp family chromosome partitioning ATPase